MGRGAAKESPPVGADVEGQQAARRLTGGLIVDLDDTLITNYALYARSRMLLLPIYSRLCGGTRGDDDLIALHKKRSADLVSRYGYTPTRWRIACRETGCLVAGRELSSLEEAEIAAAAEVALGVGEMYPGTRETLALLHDSHVPMALLTKGEQAKQQEKITHHHLTSFFEERIMIVDRKDADTMREAARRFGFTDPVVIGDSLASDIAPALEAGFAAIHIDRGEERWHIEQEGHLPHGVTVSSFAEAITVLLDVPVEVTGF